MMTGYSSSKVAVKDSFDDDEVSDDVEDEVFIRDGRNGFKVDEEMGVKRPLMAPRRKYKHFNVDKSKKPFYKKFWVPYCYGIIAIAAVSGSIIGATLFMNVFPSPLYNLRFWSVGGRNRELSIIPCTDFSTDDVWYQSFPKLMSEAALVLIDINHDNVDDIILGFSTGVEESNMPGSCKGFKGSKGICGGGAVAVDGKLGDVLWQHWTRKDVLFVDCSANVNADKTNDCLLSGKGGVLCMVDGLTGSLIWELTKSNLPQLLDIYSAQYIPDLDGDGFSDVLVAHSSDQSGHLVILNGRGGQVIGQLEAPDKEGIFTAPRIMVAKDGTYMVVFATGSLESGGTLYATSLHNIAVSGGAKHCSNVWHSDMGVSSGIVLADMNGDRTEDIILASGDTLTVLDGGDYSMLWNITTNSILKDQAQILGGPTPAYFDDDVVPDLLISYMIGPAFPTFYYSQTIIMNGKNGIGLLDEPILGAEQITAPGVAVSFTGSGNDMFLFWMPHCNTKLQQLMKPFLFARGTTVHERAHANLCHLRFNRSLDIQMYALNQHIEPPGILIYSSNARWPIEHNSTSKPSKNLQKNKTHSKNGNKSKQHILSKSPLDQISNYPIYSPETGDNRNILRGFPRYQQGSIEESLGSTRDATQNILPMGISLGELAMDYEPIYPQDVESDDVIASDQRDNDGRDEQENFLGHRVKRHATKSNTLPRATTTAALSKPLSGNGIDVLFATYWEVPSPSVRILTERDQRCIRKRVAAAQQSNNLNDLEIEMVEENAERECLSASRNPSDEELDEENKDEGGQLTLYRINLSCKCTNLDHNKEICSSPLPLNQQSYSHRAGDVYFKGRKHHFNN